MFKNQYSARRAGADEQLTRALFGSLVALLVVCLSSWTAESGPSEAQQLSAAPTKAPARTAAQTTPVVVAQLEPVLP